ncbi:MAG: MFS transporter [Desulfomicrobium sp.]|nr:MFS transporter [Desulfomicrobium sp.]NLV96081.1 MFS transporter [Desulfovibrionales bacterium]
MQSHLAALAAAAVASFLVPFMLSAVAILLPAIQFELGATAVELSWVVGSYILTLATILLPVGRLSDIYGRRRTFMWGTTVFVFFSLCVSLVWSVQSLIVMRALQGIGAAMILSTATAIVTEIYPQDKRGRALGILAACVYLGLSIGPLVGGFISDLAGWRAVFFVGLPPGIVCWFLAYRLQGEWRPSRGENFDLLSGILYGVFVLCCVKGLTGLDHPQIGIPLLIGALIAGILFIRRSQIIPYPLMKMALFTHNRVFAMSSLATLINYSSTHAVGFLLSLYLQVAKGFSPMHAGLILIIQPVVQSFLSPVAGMLADRFDPSKLASLGMGLCVVGLVGMYGVNIDTNLWTIGLILALMGMGFALFAAPNMTVIMSSVEPRDYSIASSLVATMRTFGMSLSMGVITVVFGLKLHGQPVAPDTVPGFLASMEIIFAFCAVLCVVGVFCSLVRSRFRLAQEPMLY